MFVNTPCATNLMATDTVVVHVVPTVTPSVALSISPQVVCDGSLIQATALSVNGGTAPGYTWYMNGIPLAGNSDNIAISNVTDGDVLSVTMNSTADCASPDTATAQLSVNTVAVNPSLSLGIDSVCTETGYVYQWFLAGAYDPNFQSACIPFSCINTSVYVIATDTNGCTGISQTIVCNATQELIDGSGPDVYPNPADRAATLPLPSFSEWKIRICNLQGQLIEEQTSIKENRQKSVTIDTSGWPAGMYMVIATGSQGTFRFRFAVSH
jgi:hypothetical protein